MDLLIGANTAGSQWAVQRELHKRIKEDLGRQVCLSPSPTRPFITAEDGISVVDKE